MSDAEVASFLDEQRTVTCATAGPRGWPHLMPLWYVTRASGSGGAQRLWSWTYASSQKVRRRRSPGNVAAHRALIFAMTRALTADCAALVPTGSPGPALPEFVDTGHACCVFAAAADASANDG